LGEDGPAKKMTGPDGENLKKSRRLSRAISVKDGGGKNDTAGTENGVNQPTPGGKGARGSWWKLPRPKRGDKTGT